MFLFIQVMFNLNILTYIVTQNIWLTLKECLYRSFQGHKSFFFKFCHFIAFLWLLLDRYGSFHSGILFNADNFVTM